jgi:hypothetical protein
VTKSAVMGAAPQHHCQHVFLRGRGDLAWPLWAMAGSLFAGLGHPLRPFMLYVLQKDLDRFVEKFPFAFEKIKIIYIAAGENTYCTALWGTHSPCLLMLSSYAFHRSQQVYFCKYPEPCRYRRGTILIPDTGHSTSLSARPTVDSTS